MAASDPAGAAPTAAQFRLSRTFDAPRELVFRAWTQPGHLAKWWGPAGMALIKCDMDLRPGGVFLYGMRMADGQEMWGKWVFRRIEPPALLEFLVSFCDPQGTPVRHPMAPEWPLEVLSTLSLTEEDGRTTLRMTGTPHAATPREHEVFAGATASMEQGWGGTLGNFETYLAQIQQDTTR